MSDRIWIHSASERDAFSPIRHARACPGIHALNVSKSKDVDGRDKPGHDEFAFLSTEQQASRSGLDPRIHLF
jgi:hypothetical protein